MPTALAVHQIASTRTAWMASVSAKTPIEQPRVRAIRVHSLVHGADGPLDPQPPQQRHGARERPPRRAREDGHAEQDGGDDERELDPEVGADVVFAEREREADGGERKRGRAAEGALEQHRAGDRPAAPGMPPATSRRSAPRRRPPRSAAPAPPCSRRSTRGSASRSRSSMERARSSRCQRHAIGSTVTVMIATAAARYQ